MCARLPVKCIKSLSAIGWKRYIVWRLGTYPILRANLGESVIYCGMSFCHRQKTEFHKFGL